MTDNDIIEQLRQRTYTTALKGLYHVFPMVKKYIRANSGSGDDAQDIFQDALVVLCNKVQSADFKLTVPLKHYLMAIVRNCWLQELRNRNKFPPGDSGKEMLEEESNSEASYYIAKKAFDQLGEKCRQLLLLFYFKKENYKKIALNLAFSDEKVAKNQKYLCLQKAKENYLSLLKNGQHAKQQ
jgi:RNA polymerase sigma factor (sigma-70 family)